MPLLVQAEYRLGDLLVRYVAPDDRPAAWGLVILPLALESAAVTPREFIDLVFPTSPYTHAPYRQAPGLVWMSIANHSQSGYTRLVRRRGGVGLALASYACDERPEIQGENRLWTKCVLRLVGPERDTTTQRWFGTILERAGRFKLIGYANQF